MGRGQSAKLIVGNPDQFSSGMRVALASTLEERLEVHGRELERISIFLEPIHAPMSPNRVANALENPPSG
jgi:hypothetical protein